MDRIIRCRYCSEEVIASFIGAHNRGCKKKHPELDYRQEQVKEIQSAVTCGPRGAEFCSECQVWLIPSERQRHFQAHRFEALRRAFPEHEISKWRGCLLCPDVFLLTEMGDHLRAEHAGAATTTARMLGHKFYVQEAVKPELLVRVQRTKKTWI